MTKNNIRVFVDLEVTGNAKGGLFVKNDLKDIIIRIEQDNTQRVVGIVYDGTKNLEILTKPVEDLNKLDILKGIKSND
mgnify:FL=1|jgi:hypothetical protein